MNFKKRKFTWTAFCMAFIFCSVESWKRVICMFWKDKLCSKARQRTSGLVKISFISDLKFSSIAVKRASWFWQTKHPWYIWRQFEQKTCPQFPIWYKRFWSGLSDLKSKHRLHTNIFFFWWREFKFQSRNFLSWLSFFNFPTE